MTKKVTYWQAIAAVLAAVALTEAVWLFDPNQDPVVAEFSGETLKASQLDAKLRELFAKETLQDMITERLVDKSIEQAKVTVSEEELKAWIADYKKRPDAQELVYSNQLDIAKLQENLRRCVPMYKVILADVPESERKAFFRAHSSSFEELELKGILLGSEEEAKELAVRIKGEDGFSAMASVHSLDVQSRDIGGNLGRVTKSELEESFDPLSVKELFEQKIGTVSAPMAANGGGWYLFWVKGRSTDYEHLRLRVMEVLAAEKLQGFLEKLRRQANVKIILPSPEAPSSAATSSKPVPSAAPASPLPASAAPAASSSSPAVSSSTKPPVAPSPSASSSPMASHTLPTATPSASTSPASTTRP